MCVALLLVRGHFRLEIHPKSRAQGAKTSYDQRIIASCFLRWRPTGGTPGVRVAFRAAATMQVFAKVDLDINQSDI